MKRSAGFTLIELVIVIVILGILGAVAAPKLFNLQGDAYGANLNAMKSSISTSMTMANAKAQIKGEGLGDAAGENENNTVSDYGSIEFAFGYPVASDTVTEGILGTLESFDADRYDLGAETAGTLTISPKAAADSTKCVLTYVQATDASTPAKVEVVTTGC